LPAPESDLSTLRQAAPFELPESYLAFLAISNGGEGDLAVDPGWISFWPANDVLALNSSYAVQELAPGLFGFASNGGGELIALDTLAGGAYPVVMVPFAPMQRELARALARDFDALLPLLGVNADAA
jgi:hypothetical protein